MINHLEVQFDGGFTPREKHNFLNGSTITLIKSRSGLVAGSQKHYELWVQGGIITITDQREVEAIDRIIKEAEDMKVDTKEYLTWTIENEGLN